MKKGVSTLDFLDWKFVGLVFFVIVLLLLVLIYSVFSSRAEEQTTVVINTPTGAASGLALFSRRKKGDISKTLLVAVAGMLIVILALFMLFGIFGADVPKIASRGFSEIGKIFG